MTHSFARRTRSIVAAAAAAGCLTACMTLGHPFPTENVRMIAIGQATQADIRAAYGPPYQTGVEDGDVTWTYLNYKLRVFGQQCTQDLVVRFDARGTVKSFTYNSTVAGSCSTTS